MKVRRPRTLKDNAAEARQFRGRTLFALMAVAVIFAALVGRFTWLQIFRYDEFATRSEANRFSMRAVPPTRGLIFDRAGRLLADNQPAYRLEIVPEQVDDLDDTLERLANVVQLDADDIDRFRELHRARGSFHRIPIRLRLTDAEVARFAVSRFRFSGVDIVPYRTRVYPFAETLAHVVGYVGRLGPDDLKRTDASQYAATSHIGKTGIERYYESRLHGSVGQERIETNAQGRTLSVAERRDPVAGEDLRLTIDAQLQQAAVDALAGRAGAIVAINPADGAILALVSQPGFDPNLFVNGISNTDYSALLSSPYRPLFNRALQGGYEPGSTIKPYVALAGLELGVVRRDTTVDSIGYYQLPGQSRQYRDWRPGGHGEVDVVESIAQSVNLYFYQLAVELGINRMHDYLAQFGFGATTGIDLGGEIAGVLPSPEWKQRVHGRVWFPGETVISGIGQGYSVASPLQLSHAVATLAMRGEGYQPHLLSTGVPVADQLVPVADPRNWEAVIAGMRGVMHGAQGTARAVMEDQPGFEIAGKTGTAQVYGRREGEASVRAEDLPEHLRHHALFVAFAPARAPEIAIAVVVEHGGSGSAVAAPVGRQVIDAWFARSVP